MILGLTVCCPSNWSGQTRQQQALVDGLRLFCRIHNPVVSSVE
jgi:hypothetical protein